MCQLLETICLKNGKFQNLSYHQLRLKNAMAELFPDAATIHLNEALVVPDNCHNGIFKVRVIYRQFIEKIEFHSYQLRKIESLKIVCHDSIDYHLKYTNRQLLQNLFDQRGSCDDIIIVRKGFVTDSFAANVLFFDGSTWLTPSTPLLKGTQRASLIDRGIVVEREIGMHDLPSFQKVGLINAMTGFDDMSQIPVQNVFGF